jgi:hypothetical protein
MKKLLVVLAMVVTLISSVSAGKVEAWPGSCSYFIAGTQVYGRCTSGYGTYRVIGVISGGARCYGSQVGVGWGWSIAECYGAVPIYAFFQKANA